MYSEQQCLLIHVQSQISESVKWLTSERLCQNKSNTRVGQKSHQRALPSKTCINIYFHHLFVHRQWNVVLNDCTLQLGSPMIRSHGWPLVPPSGKDKHQHETHTVDSLYLQRELPLVLRFIFYRADFREQLLHRNVQQDVRHLRRTRPKSNPCLQQTNQGSQLTVTVSAPCSYKQPVTQTS